MVVRQQRLDLRMLDNALEEFARNVGLEQAVAVFRIGRVVPHRIIDAEAHEPPEQQVVIELLDQLALGTERIKRLQQRNTQEAFWRDRPPPERFIHGLEIGIECAHHIVNDTPDQPQRMVRRHTLFDVDIRKQRTCRGSDPRMSPPCQGWQRRIIFARTCQQSEFQQPVRATHYENPWP